MFYKLILMFIIRLDKVLPSVAIPVEEEWGKTKEVFKYIYKFYDGKYDWILRAEDDT